MCNGEERPIAFASRSLSKAEKGYSQLEKEALSIIFGLRKFHQYVFGKKFLLITDHQPLVKILGSTTGIPTLAAARIQRWALTLASHTYDIKFRSSEKHSNADGLSRLPLPVTTSEKIDAADVHNMSQIAQLPVTYKMIAKQTITDSLLSKVHTFILTGWPSSTTQEILPYFNRRHELTVQQHCILWGVRVIIPSVFREQILNELHQGHPGIVRMKSLARSIVWWPGLDSEIEDTVKSCSGCQRTIKTPSPAPLHPWNFPSQPWERLHIDYAGPFLGYSFLVIVDAFSKWPEVIKVTKTDASHTIEVLRSIFARFGLPKEIVSDNGTQFTSQEFSEFTVSNGIKHICSSPFHPSTNGQAERLVQTFKNAMKRNDAKLPVSHALADFLLSYRNTPQATTGDSPANLLMKRNLRTRLDLIRPSLQERVTQNQEKQVLYRDRRATQRDINVGDSVLVRDYRGHDKWMKGTVEEKTGPVSFKVKTSQGVMWRRHLDQTVKRNTPINPCSAHTDKSSGSESASRKRAARKLASPNTTSTPADTTPRRYPRRERLPPKRLDL